MGALAGDRLPSWVTLLRAPNPGPMTLDGTNTWVLRAGAGVVVDPGPLDEGHLARIAEHGPFEFILITHGHHDHIEGAARLSELLGGTPILAPPPPGRMTVGDLTIDVLATPGHTADSVCFEVTAAGGESAAGERVLLSGDTLLGRGTTVVAWPDGDLGAYLESLALLTSYRRVLMLPGHGPVRDDCGAVAESYLAHREQRLAQVRAAVAAGADTAEAVVDVVYPDIEPGVRFAAVWSAQAQLDFLRRESPEPSPRLDRL